MSCKTSKTGFYEVMYRGVDLVSVISPVRMPSMGAKSEIRPLDGGGLRAWGIEVFGKP